MDPHVARILDANFNRAREALRVMEDYARFAMDDPAGCESIKNLRHTLAECIQSLPTGALLAARDTPGDVGTTISTDREQHRPDPRAVCVAAAKRLPEALRTLEEYTKTWDATLAARFEALRYRAYAAESQLMLRAERSARFARVRLYVLLTAAMCRKNWVETASDAITGGAGCLQLREKDLDDAALLERARQLVELCRTHNALAIINDRPDIARLADADGVHLGQTDLPVAQARTILGPDRLVGASTHTTQQIEAALDAEPDYIAVGPMYPSPTKPQETVPGPALIAQAHARTRRPVVAIGGITPDRLPQLIAAGVQCICACAAVIATDDVTGAARNLALPAATDPDSGD